MVSCSPSCRVFQSQTHRDDSVAPACQSQHLLEEYLSCPADRRQEDDWTSNALWAGIIQRPHLTVIIINNNLVERKQSEQSKVSEVHHGPEVLSNWQQETNSHPSPEPPHLYDNKGNVLATFIGQN